ncbi:reverse transcriptase domain-containing protein [Tanacetum coccineum]
MTFDRSRSSLVLHQMTSDHNRSELGIQDHSNELSSSKLVPTVVPLANKTATSRQELELLFYFHIPMLRKTGQTVVSAAAYDYSGCIMRLVLPKIMLMLRSLKVNAGQLYCMRTRSSLNLIAESSTTPKRHNRRRSKQRVEPFSLEETSVVMMAELLQAPTEGYGDAIVIPAILAKNFELKHGLLNLVTSKQFYGFEKEDPHAHIRWFNKITSTIKYRDVPNSSIKLMLFPFSIEGAARIWLEKEPPRSILTWEDLVSKFINQFFPPSKTTNLRNEIMNFQQRFDESFCEA